MSDDILGLAARFFDAIERADFNTIHECFAPGAVVWHNTDTREMSKEEDIDAIHALVDRVDSLRWRDRRVDVIDGGLGFVQQSRLVGSRRSDGAPIEMHGVVVARVENGQITRIDEYVDSAATARIKGLSQ